MTKEVANALNLGQFEAFANEFADEHLDSYIAQVSKHGANPSRKEINDPLWGTIGISGAEVVVIDSPLLQRLRSVRQLGVVHWVYPGAIHTRFEHSLGVLRQVEYLTSAINNLGVQEGLGVLVDASKANLLRLAALLHDVGHAAFSHVSEHAIERLDALAAIPAEFGRQYQAEQRSLSEIFAFFVVRSPSMKRLVEIILNHDSGYISLNTNREVNVREIIEKLSHLIIGRSIDDRLPLLHEIISGPFDADKLDYFVRDARSAGTPSLLDISRLIQKLALRDLDSTELPGTSGRHIKVKNRHVLLGIKWSGISVLDELHLSRVLLYSKIYRHQKVVAIEQMIKAALVLLASASNASAVLGLIYRHNDDELLAMSAATMAEVLRVDVEAASEDVRLRIEKAASILKDVRRRRLVAKAFQLQRTYPGSNQTQDDTQRNGLIEFREVIEHPEEREEFRLRLIAEVSRIVDLLQLEKRSDVELEGAIMVHPIGKTPGGTQIGRAFLITKTGSPIEFKDYLVNRTAWADSYLSDQPAGYIFAERDIADVTFIAVERILRTDHRIQLPDSALEMSKRDADNIQRIKDNLKDAGYYSDAPYDLRPEPARLGHADIARSIQNFATTYGMYQAPVEKEGGAQAREDANIATRNWLKQFDTNDNIECAAHVLSSIKMIDRTDTVEALHKFITTNPEFKDSVVIPFGSARDSGAIHGYFAADLIGDLVSECMSLDDACQQKNCDRPIIFLDDFVGSGGQSRDILAAGFGREDLRVDLAEDRDLFSSDIQRFLQSAKIGFVFTAAWNDGLQQLEKTTSDIGLNSKIFGMLGEDDIPFIENVLNEFPQEQRGAFIKRSREIGASLIRTGSARRPNDTQAEFEQRIASRSLGYGNRGMLLVSPFNVPTQTFTPLWANGKVDDVQWTPLLPRRKKR